MEIIQTLGNVPLRSTWRFRDDKVEETRSQGGRSERTIRARPAEPWFTPSGALSEITRLGEVETPMTLRVVDPANGLEPIETASRDEIAALQIQRLRWSLRHAYTNVPHYRATMDAATRMASPPAASNGA